MPLRNYESTIENRECDIGNYPKVHDVGRTLLDPRNFQPNMSPVASTTLFLPHLYTPIMPLFNRKVHSTYVLIQIPVFFASHLLSHRWV